MDSHTVSDFGELSKALANVLKDSTHTKIDASPLSPDYFWGGFDDRIGRERFNSPSYRSARGKQGRGRDSGHIVSAARRYNRNGQVNQLYCRRGQGNQLYCRRGQGDQLYCRRGQGDQLDCRREPRRPARLQTRPHPPTKLLINSTHTLPLRRLTLLTTFRRSCRTFSLTPQTGLRKASANKSCCTIRLRCPPHRVTL